MRLSEKQLEEIKNKYGVKLLWSFSRFDLYRTSHYEWFLKYILKKKEDNPKVSAYGIIGGVVHDLIEKLYEGKIKRENLINEFENEWLVNIGALGLYFDRNDSDKNNMIKSKYYDNIKLFFKDYNMLDYKMINEQFVSIKVSDDIVFQGYIDALYKDNDGFINIVDYKTSTKYSGNAIKEHAGQLLLYAEGIRQLGVPKEKIRICWNFLKYCNFSFVQKNGKEKVRTIERRVLGEKIKNTVIGWMRDLDYSESEIDEYIENLIFTNDTSILPKDIQEKFTIDDCYVYVDDIWDKYDELRKEIIDTITNDINVKVTNYNINNDEEIFFDDKDNLDANSYYYSNLCGYSINTLKPYKQYLEDLNIINENNSNNEKENDINNNDLLALLNLI